ncbi:hypothetical protein KFK14_02250 [Sphingobium phenoxybenzoativorans]|uniref:Uncharacterized protein n=1 Tax=Sphingobium phenoxybenzoativorans TaxID=1592790 RepID=A0A975Q201_9SPHN|nr:hypothetical protein [Sphingobium phenoxybenzoativorans]QUT06324.1 hypothetical protein KFK14_02250 [Sphingobium phenoxybenzoativorans]
MTQPIELFSLENVALWLFGAIVGLSGLLDFLMLISAQSRFRPWIEQAMDGMDGFFQSFYNSARLIPWILSALLISVLAPVYDMYADVSWSDTILHAGGDARTQDMSWPKMLIHSHVRTLPTFIHVAQTAILLFALWLYALLWNYVLDVSGEGRVISLDRGKRFAFMGGFVGVVLTSTSYVLNYLGKHAEVALRLSV